MMVILAALLCALIGALVINSIIRCAIRFSQRFTIDPDQVLSELAPTGLSKDALSQIPVVAYESGLEIPVKECCPICLGEFSGGEKVRILPKCGHGFHVKCIDTWLLSHSSCPNCRVSGYLNIGLFVGIAMVLDEPRKFGLVYLMCYIYLFLYVDSFV